VFVAKRGTAGASCEGSINDAVNGMFLTSIFDCG
jgi:hypothetical protein